MKNEDFDNFNGFDGFDGFGEEETDNSNLFANTENTVNDFGNTQEQTNTFTDTPDINEKKNLSKRSLLLIVVGIILFILVLLFANLINNIANKKQNNTSNNVAINNNTVQEANKSDASSILNEKPIINSPEVTVKTVKDNELSWVEITDSENVSFNSEYKDMTFLITGIKHYARAVDSNNNLVIKTTLSGGLSGLTGVYTLDIPYDKGVRLVVGDQFTVHVQLGAYNSKSVIGEIKY